MPPKTRRSKAPKQDEAVIPLSQAQPPKALLIPELLELILSFAAYSYTQVEQDEELKGLKDLWCRYRAVCKFWKEIVETSTSPSIAGITFHSKAVVQDHTPPALTIHPLGISLMKTATQGRYYWNTPPYCYPGAAAAVKSFRNRKYPKMFATYPAVTGMRAFASRTKVPKKSISRVNTDYLMQKDAIVSWDDEERYWYFEADDKVTVEHFVAFATNVFEIGGTNFPVDKRSSIVRIEFLRPDEGVVGLIDLKVFR
ncbi:hypothetical protein ABW20_dc0107853 [Dactylellina cionopaga]|nr:hypothetical protein ABW20_dc0107853 [Dactylellina cionopaga]